MPDPLIRPARGSHWMHPDRDEIFVCDRCDKGVNAYVYLHDVACSGDVFTEPVSSRYKIHVRGWPGAWYRAEREFEAWAAQRGES